MTTMRQKKGAHGGNMVSPVMNIVKAVQAAAGVA
jgi:hypothetical protein